MKNSVSDQSFYLESDEDDEERGSEKGEDGNDSDSSCYSNGDENRQHSKAGSLDPSWPQSYRQSINLYGSVPSPSLNFLGPPSLSQLGSSFLTSSFRRRRTPEILPSIIKPSDQADKQRSSSHSLLSPTLSRKSSLRRVLLDKRASIEYEIPISGRSTFGQAVINGINVICGVGLLSTPYAMREGGWFGIFVLLIFAVLSYYTGILLRSCLDSQPGLETYPDIGQAAFGTTGLDKVNIHAKGSTLNLSTLPVAIGLYGFCYSGHAVIPNIYSSMENPSQFPIVLLTSFGICTVMYAGAATMGYIMFGETTQSQFTLNMPKDLVASKIALWTTENKNCFFLNYEYICVNHVSGGDESGGINSIKTSQIPNVFDPHKDSFAHYYTLSVRLAGLVSALIGSLLTMLVTLILPCVCYLSILREKTNLFQTSACVLVIVVGVIASALGTYSALSKIIESLS
ncbi:vacuolar amino acid transporter 1 [Phtheirospermum japonicum]|uniref:Vacuolar amino acid transporter 1 n=1 Tax=Phtheirospermum japonicum TaxID=374723 RepID=A0A830CRI7_9LAMI|nr:vacuolar amino acid transporter 1 [Phtheirospermum japonicum]